MFIIAEEPLQAETSSRPSVLPLPTEPVEGWAWAGGRGRAGTRDLEVRQSEPVRSKDSNFRPCSCPTFN